MAQQEDRLNVLEASIVAADDSAEDARWLQAKEVVRRLDAGETQEAIAATWINLRTGKPYSQPHVGRCARIWREHGLSPMGLKPTWVEAYTATRGPEDPHSEVEQRQAMAPKTIKTAEKLVDNIMQGPPGVQDAVYHGLKLARAYPHLATEEGRKSADAWAEESTKPLKQWVANLGFATGRVTLSLEQAVTELREDNEAGVIQPAEHVQAIQALYEQLGVELQVATFKVGETA